MVRERWINTPLLWGTGIANGIVAGIWGRFLVLKPLEIALNTHIAFDKALIAARMETGDVLLVAGLVAIGLIAGMSGVLLYTYRSLQD